MAGVAFEQVSKMYGDDTRAVDRLDLEIEDGEFTVLVGPSGCGKTTALPRRRHHRMTRPWQIGTTSLEPSD